MKNGQVKLSLIISIYKRIDYLELVFKSLRNQTFKDFEVVIAEDNDAEELKKFMEEQRKYSNFVVKHVYQADKGFRKSKILNEAIKLTEADFLVFIDNDCILHKKFLEEYAKNQSDDVCLFGRRVKLDKDFTAKILRSRNLKDISWFNLLKSKSTHLEEGIYLPFNFGAKDSSIIGSNFGVAKDNMLKINGFDEDFTGYGYEDIDIQWRLEKLGLKLSSLRNKAIQYHLFHEKRENQNNSFKENQKLCYKKNKNKNKGYFCKNGLIKN